MTPQGKDTAIRADGTGRQGTPTSGQFSRWGPAQPAGGGRSRVSPRTGMVPVSALSPSQEVAFPCPAARPLSQHCAARPAPRGCADRRSAFPCLRVAPLGGMGAMRQFSVRVAPSATRRALPRLRNPGERCLPFQCTDHAERWDSRREGTTSQLGVLPAARLRRAVPTRGRRSLACASLRLVAWARCASSASAWRRLRLGESSRG